MSNSLLKLLITDENGLQASQAHIVRVQAIFSEWRVIMVVSLVLVIFIVVFVIAHCCNIYNIALHGATSVYALISPTAVIQEVSHEG